MIALLTVSTIVLCLLLWFIWHALSDIADSLYMLWQAVKERESKR